MTHAPADHMAAAEREATAADAFDRLHLKQGVWEAWKAGRATLVSKVLRHTSSAVDLARVTCFLPVGMKGPDWALWARVFAWFGPATRGAHKSSRHAPPWNVIWFAAPTPRRFPLVGQDLGPEHVNGGYTRPCSTEGIFIYRAEEATRVLIHEMLHAGCMDEQPGTPVVHISRSQAAARNESGAGWSVPLREAQIEVWAELLLVALMSRGSHKTALRLWGLQSQWVADTNKKARADHNTHDIDDYAWRYLCGREVMYARHGIALPAADHERARQMRSVRFTHPTLGR
jgi:hypothetical protein